MPDAVWQPGGAVSESQLLRAEEARVPFDPARQPDLDALHAWLDDPHWPQAIRLVTGAGGLGKTRLALQLCRQRLGIGWHPGLLDPSIEPNGITVAWRDLLRFKQPLLIVIDYAETRQAVLLALVKSMLQSPLDGGQAVRVLLLARGGMVGSLTEQRQPLRAVSEWLRDLGSRSPSGAARRGS